VILFSCNRGRNRVLLFSLDILTITEYFLKGNTFERNLFK
jgi:hypothetical protein